MPKGQSSRDFLDEEMAGDEQLRDGFGEASEDMRLAVQLALRRAQLGMTQQALSHATGIPQSMISNIEHGDRGPTWPTLRKLLRGLDAVLIATPDGNVAIREADDKSEARGPDTSVSMRDQYLPANDAPDEERAAWRQLYRAAAERRYGPGD